MRTKSFLLLTLITFLVCVNTFAAADRQSPIGKWVTIDHKTQKPSGIVEITEHEGSLGGKIIAGLGIDKIRNCYNCPGNLKNAPIIGLPFLWGFVADGDNKWIHGHILDPHDGKIYRGSIRLVENGKKLQLRGYWGFFYQTETWIRTDSP